MRMSVRLRRRWRISSCPAANGIRCVNPSSATESPSCTNSAAASRNGTRVANDLSLNFAWFGCPPCEMPWRIYAGGPVLVKADYRNSVRLSANSCILRRFQAISQATSQESLDAARQFSQIHQPEQIHQIRQIQQPP